MASRRSRLEQDIVEVNYRTTTPAIRSVYKKNVSTIPVEQTPDVRTEAGPENIYQPFKSSGQPDPRNHYQVGKHGGNRLLSGEQAHTPCAY